LMELERLPRLLRLLTTYPKLATAELAAIVSPPPETDLEFQIAAARGFAVCIAT